MKTNHSFQINLLAVLLLAVFLLAGITAPAFAQDGYRVSVNKDFGFANGSQLRGDFSIALVGDAANVVSVTFLIDGQELAVVPQAPFKSKFKTQSYADGLHDLSANVTLKDGSILTSDSARFKFLSAQEESGAMQKIIIPLLAVVFGITALGMAAQFLAGRGKPAGGPEPGTARNYGFAGGSICPKCNRPTPRHMYGLNIVVGKLDRCENCGKWSIMRAYPLDVLRAAEAAERKAEQASVPASEKSEEEKLRDLLDDSRFTRS